MSLDVVYQPEKKGAALDIVFVHGLNPVNKENHALSTWSHKDGTFWPRDLLPRKIPFARVLVFQYNLNAGINDHADSLLDRFKSLRQESKTPIIFIAHSLGGLVVKQALIRANANRREFGDIKDATFGLVFFGTPHTGGNGVSIGKVVAAVVRAVNGSSGNEILRALEKDSVFSQESKDQFRSQLDDYKVVSFFETKAMRLKKFGFGIGQIIVEKESATLGLSTQREKQVSLDADHFSMCKYAWDDRGFTDVCTYILTMAEDAISNLDLGIIHTATYRVVQAVPQIQRTASTTTPLTLFLIPPKDVAFFVPRPKLTNQLQGCLDAATLSITKVVVLLGMGGQGKSQLALKYCRDSRASHTRKAIFWIDASSESSIERSFGAIARALDPVRKFENLDSLSDFVKDVIEGWEFPWLLVFDNYDRPDGMPNISTHYPRTKYGAIIVTSRHAFSKRLGLVLQLNGMSENESLDLLFSKSELERTEKNLLQAQSIVQQLGQLPLAIDQAGSYINVNCLSLSSFIDEYRAKRAEVLQFTPSLTEYRRKLNDSDAEIALNVFTTLELSLQGLKGSIEYQNAVQDFFSLSAFFNVADIREILFQLASEGSDVVWKDLFMNDGEWDSFKFRDVLIDLNSLSLLQSLSVGRTSTFSLHPLVADWLVLRMDAPSRKSYTMQSCSVVEVLIDSSEDGIMSLEDRAYWLGQTSVCWKNQCASFLISDFDDEKVLGQLFSFGSFLRDSDCYKEAEAIYIQALKGFEEVLGLDHPSTLDIVNDLGALYADQGKLAEADAMYKRALNCYEKALGPEHMSTLSTVNNLGNLYVKQGKLAEAKAMYKRGLDGYKKALGPEHMPKLQTVNNLGLLYAKQGKQAEAEAMYKQALDGMEKGWGPEHKLTLDTANNLGALYSNQGKLAEAEAMYKQALEGYEKALGPEHTSTLQTINNLGLLYAKQGKLAEAEAMYKQALDGMEKALGPEHILTFHTINNLGNLYSNQGRLAEAEAMYKGGLDSYKKALSPEHTLTLPTIYNLGLLYAKQGKQAEAEAMYKQALDGMEKGWGPEHKLTLDTANNLGALYANQGRLAEAEAMYKQALEGYEKAFGPEHTSTLQTINNLGLLYAKQGKLAEAEAMYKRALDGYEKALGPEHILTFQTINNLGNLYSNQGRLAEAEAMYKRALDGYEKA